MTSPAAQHSEQIPSHHHQRHQRHQRHQVHHQHQLCEEEESADVMMSSSSSKDEEMDTQDSSTTTTTTTTTTTPPCSSSSSSSSSAHFVCAMMEQNNRAAQKILLCRRRCRCCRPAFQSSKNDDCQVRFGLEHEHGPALAPALDSAIQDLTTCLQEASMHIRKSQAASAFASTSTSTSEPSDSLPWVTVELSTSLSDNDDDDDLFVSSNGTKIVRCPMICTTSTTTNSNSNSNSNNYHTSKKSVAAILESLSCAVIYNLGLAWNLKATTTMCTTNPSKSPKLVLSKALGMYQHAYRLMSQHQQQQQQPQPQPPQHQYRGVCDPVLALAVLSNIRSVYVYLDRLNTMTGGDDDPMVFQRFIDLYSSYLFSGIAIICNTTSTQSNSSLFFKTSSWYDLLDGIFYNLLPPSTNTALAA